MKIQEAKIFWNDRDLIIQHKGLRSPNSNIYPYSDGAVYSGWQKMNDAMALKEMFSLYLKLVIIYKLNPQKVAMNFSVLDDFPVIFKNNEVSYIESNF